MGQYLALLEDVYLKRGGLEGQRGPLKTKTAITIRNRMVEDLQSGAVIPPVVVGLLIEPSDADLVDGFQDFESFIDFVSKLEPDRVSIIDGMQRTTAIKDAIIAEPKTASLPVRVEFWVSAYLNSLIYRMLVLNSGQVPWELSRQLETVYGQFLKKITKDIGGEIDILAKDMSRRRSLPGQYQSTNIIQLLLVFSSRKTEVDLKDRVSEDFARLDAIETSAHTEFLDYYVETLKLMSSLDKEFGRYDAKDRGSETRIKSGKDIFGSFPAMAGFVAAVAVTIFDDPGFDIDWNAAPDKLRGVTNAVNAVVTRMQSMSRDQLADFMQVELLSEKLAVRSGQVGRFEREFFRRAFTAMFKNAERLPNMAPCWGA